MPTKQDLYSFRAELLKLNSFYKDYESKTTDFPISLEQIEKDKNIFTEAGNMISEYFFTTYIPKYAHNSGDDFWDSAYTTLFNRVQLFFSIVSSEDSICSLSVLLHPQLGSKKEDLNSLEKIINNIDSKLLKLNNS